MSVAAIAFDLFGTLLRLEDPLFRRQGPEVLGVSPKAWLAMVREVGLRRAFPSVEALAKALAQAAKGEDAEAASRLLAEGLVKQLATAELYQGVRATLAFLQRRRYALALVSNLSSAHLTLVDTFQLRDFFPVILASCELGMAKPEAEIFHLLSARLGLPPEEILVVGDSEAADGMASRYGFPVVLVGRELPSAAHVGWLALQGPEPSRALVGLGTSFVARDGLWEVISISPLADASQGRYNLVAAVSAHQGQRVALWYVKRFWEPNAAYVDLLARELAMELALPVPEAVVLEGVEPVLISRKAPGEPYQGSLDADTSFDLGSHLAFAYAFANADIRPRNAFVFTQGTRRRMVLIDFEHCFLNLAVPPEQLPTGGTPQALASLSLPQAQALARRQVITPKTIVRARNEFFSFKDAPVGIKRAMADGFAWCWRAMQREKDTLLSKVQQRLWREPWLPVGTWRFRRFLAPFDVEEMALRLAQDLDRVLGLFLVEE